jgi:hypothetical protein
MIIDYSTSRPSVSALKAAGVTAVGRYIGWDSVPGFPSMGKNLTREEATLLISNVISIFLFFEYMADAAAQGSSQGHNDGHLALQQLAELGAPPTMTVYFAVDFDIPDYAPHLSETPANALAKLGPVGDYFRAINNLRYPYGVGGYGGYWAVSRLFNAGLVTKGCQSTAWSPRNPDGNVRVDSRVSLFQILQAPPIPGADIDVRVNAITQPDFGQWPRPKTDPPPPPPPTPTGKEHNMIILRATAPTGHDWTGTRTFLYSGPPGVPQHIVSGTDQAAFSAVLPDVPVTWEQFIELGGS